MKKETSGMGERMDFGLEVVYQSGQQQTTASSPSKASKNFEEMVRRRELVRKGGDANEEEAERILVEVERNGGLTTEEVYALMAY